MSKTILAQVDGFTPIIDSLAHELGLVTAAVFGRIWRYCQGERGICNASLETIAGDLGLDRATVMRHAKALVEHGYLEDLTPERRNRPHTYRDTGKAALGMTFGVAESNTEPTGVAPCTAGVAQSNVGIAESNTGVAESHLKKVVKKQVKRQDSAPAKKRGRGRPEERALQDLFSELTGLPEPPIGTKRERAAAGELWFQPIRRMAALANGTSAAVLREAVARLRGRVTIACPKSVEKTFTAIVGERRTAAARPAGRIYE